MDTTKIRTRGRFSFPKSDTVTSALMLAVGFVGVGFCALQAVIHVLGA